VTTATFRVGRFSSTPLEPYALTCWYDPSTEEYNLVANDQQPGRSIANIARALDVPVHKINLSVPESGGSFGIKLAVWPYMLLACLLARRVDRPLKWIQTRTEHLLGGTHAPDVEITTELAVSEEGKFLGLRVHSRENDGAFVHTAGIYGLIKFATIVGPYTIRASSLELTSVVTNRGPVVQNRGVGKPAMTFALERTVDLAAKELGLDPVDIRRRNLVQPEQMPYTTPAGEIYESGDYPRVLDMALEMVDYPRLREEQAEARANGRLVGIGISNGIEPGTSNIGYYALMKGETDFQGNTEGALVGIENDGRVSVATGSVDSGQGHETAISQVVADVLGVSTDLIDFTVSFDSRRSPYTGHSGTYSNRFNDVEIGAVMTASRRIKEKLVALASHVLDVPQSDLTIADGAVATGSRSLSFAELARSANNKSVLLPEGMEPGMRTTAYYRNPMAKVANREDFNIQLTHSNSVHIVVAEIDRGTGKVPLTRYAIVHDCGTQLNPIIVEGMAIGSTVHGIGGALLEEFSYDDDCHPLATTFQTYVKPVAQTVPRIEIRDLETPCPFTLLGTKATGEGGSITSLAAIGNAVEDALTPFGSAVRSLPITAEKVLRAIEEGQDV
jgi:2-furoyl-CoA dehydrogenase large subunit